MEKIEAIARAIILDEAGEKILFCAPKDKSYYYLPGGHIEFEETARIALKRELLEEIGMETDDSQFVFFGTDENIFLQEGQKHHEVNLYFKVPISDAEKVLSREDRIVFSWIFLSELSQFPIFPESLKKKCEDIAKEKDISWNNI